MIEIMVIETQKKLKTLGYDPGPADGIIGKRTKSAIAQYQKSKSLIVTESLDKNTLSSLGIELSNE